MGPSKYETFDRTRLKLLPLSERIHDLPLARWLSLDESAPPFEHPDLDTVAERLVAARSSGAARILMMGAHVLRAGVNAHIIDMMERGLIDHIAMNGAGAIHDYELARIGATTESVARYISSGQFGLWKETGELNDWIVDAFLLSTGMGENIGRRIEESDYPYKHLSVFAAAWRLSIPVTVHVGIGYDILHEHPNCSGAALGDVSYRDFLIFANTVSRLEGGVLLSFGSAIMGPEVYLKALAMTRNVAHQEGRVIRHFTTAVFDLVPIEGDIHRELTKQDPGYYFRPHKTMLVRTVADGGESFYFCGDHRATSRRCEFERLVRNDGIGKILAAIPRLNTLVVGDLCLDRWCTYDPYTSEPSRETGIPRIGVVSSESTPGAAGTVASNLVSLGVHRVAVLGAIGEDGHGFELLKALALRGISAELSVKSPLVGTFTYTKLLNLETGVEDVSRIDYISTRPVPAAVEEQLLHKLESYIDDFDVILVSDQAETHLGGVVTPAIRDSLAKLALRFPDKVIWADSRMRAEHFRNVIVKPNRSEAAGACTRQFGAVDFGKLRQHTNAPFVIVTDGPDGVLVVQESGETRVPTRPEPNPVDICGAGDSFSAAAATAYAVTRDPLTAALFGNMVASITIMKKGTGTASSDEVLAAERSWPA